MVSQLEPQPTSTVLATSLHNVAPGISTYADAARALSKSATPLETRLSLIRALESLEAHLTPSPAHLVASHVAYALTHSASAPTPAARAAYFAALRTGIEGRPLVNAAVAALRGESQEAAAVLGVLEKPGRVKAGLEARADLVAAGLACLGSEAVGGDVKGKAVAVMRTLVSEWSDAQERCGNAKRVFGVALNVVVAALAGLPKTAEIGLVAPLAAETALKGLLASPSAILEHAGYYASLYTWLGGANAWTDVAPFFAALLRECAAASRKEGGDRHISSKRKNEGSAGIAEAEFTDAGGNVLPRVILIPLMFLKHLTVTARSMLQNASDDRRAQAAALSCIAELFVAAASESVYRTSYDARPVSRESGRKRRRVADKEASPSTVTNGKDPADASTTKNKSAASEEASTVGGEIAATCLAVASLAKTSLCEPATDDASGVVAGACKAMCASLRLSLDSVTSHVQDILQALQIHSRCGGGAIPEHVTEVLCCLVECYAATRQLSQLFVEFAALEGGLKTLRAVLVQDMFRNTIVSAVCIAPRGQPESCVASLFASFDGSVPGSSKDSNRTGAECDFVEVQERLLLSRIVMESAAAVEHEALGKVVAETVIPLLQKLPTQAQDSGALELLLQAKSSMLFIMASAGYSLLSPVFSKALFAGLEADAGGGSSTPDSDSSDYDAFIARRQRRESPKARFSQLVSEGNLQCGEGTAVASSVAPGPQHAMLATGRIATRIKFFASLAHVRVSDKPRTPSSPSGDSECRTSDLICERPGRELRLCIRECWSLFAELDIRLVIQDKDMAQSLLSAGGSVLYLSDVTRPWAQRDLEGHACHDKRGGFLRFLAIALECTWAGDALWAMLWESAVVKKTFVDVLESIVACNRSRSAVGVALDRCLHMPRNYLDASDEERLTRCCGRVASGSDRDLCLRAIRVLSARLSIPADVIACVHEALAGGSVHIGECTEAILAPVLRGVDASGETEFITTLMLIVEKVESSKDLQWLLRGINCGYSEVDSDLLSRPGLRRVLKVLPLLVERFLVAESSDNALVTDAVPSAHQLLRLVCFLGKDLTSTTVNESYLELRQVAERVVKVVLPGCCSSRYRLGKTEAEFLSFFVEGGTSSACHTVLGTRQGNDVAIRIGVTAVDWISLGDCSETSRRGSTVLRALVSGCPSAKSLAESICQGVYLELSKNVPPVQYVHSASVLLCAGVGSADLVVTCLRLVKSEMRLWNWFGEAASDEVSILGESGETSTSALLRERCSLVCAAVAGAEVWTRACLSSSGRKWDLEYILQVCVDICVCSRVNAKTLMLVLKICATCARVRTSPSSQSRSAPTGTLWLIQRVLAAVLSHPSRLDAEMTSLLCRVYEAVVNSCSSSQWAPPVVVAMTVDMANALSRVTSGTVRRGFAAGASVLLGAGPGRDLVAASAMSLLSSDMSRDVLRAIRAEAVEDGTFYRGRA